ncbi:MAG: hypothetical protein ACK5NN_15755 [Sphingomonadaceae bacterium]
MPDRERETVVMDGLQCLADTWGDIVDPAMERFYKQYPDALESFEYHGLGERHNLEGMMIEQVIYFLMTWPEDPSEISIIMDNSVRHHHDVLQVFPRWYIGLIDAVIGLIFEALPDNSDNARRVWREIRDELAKEIELSREGFYRKDNAGPLPVFGMGKDAG